MKTAAHGVQNRWSFWLSSPCSSLRLFRTWIAHLYLRIGAKMYWRIFLWLTHSNYDFWSSFQFKYEVIKSNTAHKNICSLASTPYTMQNAIAKSTVTALYFIVSMKCYEFRNTLLCFITPSLLKNNNHFFSYSHETQIRQKSNTAHLFISLLELFRSFFSLPLRAVCETIHCLVCSVGIARFRLVMLALSFTPNMHMERGRFNDRFFAVFSACCIVRIPVHSIFTELQWIPWSLWLSNCKFPFALKLFCHCIQ